MGAGMSCVVEGLRHLQWTSRSSSNLVRGAVGVVEHAEWTLNRLAVEAVNVLYQ
jgi:hypothetical protein